MQERHLEDFPNRAILVNYWISVITKFKNVMLAILFFVCLTTLSDFKIKDIIQRFKFQIGLINKKKMRLFVFRKNNKDCK